MTLLNVGDGYVWASAIAGTSSAVRMIFFIDFYVSEMTPALFQSTPAVVGWVVGSELAHAVELRMVESCESGIVHFAI